MGTSLPATRTALTLAPRATCFRDSFEEEWELIASLGIGYRKASEAKCKAFLTPGKVPPLAAALRV